MASEVVTRNQSEIYPLVGYLTMFEASRPGLLLGIRALCEGRFKTAGLTDREAATLRARYGLEDGKPRSYEELAYEWNVAEQRVRQLERSGLRKLLPSVEFPAPRGEDVDV